MPSLTGVQAAWESWRGRFVCGMVQDERRELAFVLLQVSKDLLHEFFSGGGHRSFAWREWRLDAGVRGSGDETYDFSCALAVLTLRSFTRQLHRRVAVECSKLSNEQL
jgi:hypothetical protein